LLTVVAAAWTDFQQWRIPNRLLVPSAAAALMLFCSLVICLVDAKYGRLWRGEEGRAVE
jgi:Flp pilus assembly protein protease CpaA